MPKPSKIAPQMSLAFGPDPPLQPRLRIHKLIDSPAFTFCITFIRAREFQARSAPLQPWSSVAPVRQRRFRASVGYDRSLTR